MDTITAAEKALDAAARALEDARVNYEKAQVALNEAIAAWTPYDLTDRELATWRTLEAQRSTLIAKLEAGAATLAEIAALAGHDHAAQLESLVARVIRGEITPRQRPAAAAQPATAIPAPSAPSETAHDHTEPVAAQAEDKQAAGREGDNGDQQPATSTPRDSSWGEAETWEPAATWDQPQPDSDNPADSDPSDDDSDSDLSDMFDDMFDDETGGDSGAGTWAGDSTPDWLQSFRS